MILSMAIKKSKKVQKVRKTFDRSVVENVFDVITDSDFVSQKIDALQR